MTIIDIGSIVPSAWTEVINVVLSQPVCAFPARVSRPRQYRIHNLGNPHNMNDYVPMHPIDRVSNQFFIISTLMISLQLKELD